MDRVVGLWSVFSIQVAVFCVVLVSFVWYCIMLVYGHFYVVFGLLVYHIGLFCLFTPIVMKSA